MHERIEGGILRTHDPRHGEPHGQSATQPFSNHEADDATRQGAKVVDGDDNTFKSTAWVAECSLPILVSHNAAENSLVIAKENKGH